MQSDVYSAFRSIGIAEEASLKAADALAKRDSDVTGLKADLQVVKWMQGSTLAFVVAIVIKLFIH